MRKRIGSGIRELGKTNPPRSSHARRDCGAAPAAEDEQRFQLAAAEERVIVSADTDFGTLIAQRSETKPSVILFRHGIDHRPRVQVEILLAKLPATAEALLDGALVTIEPTHVRARPLPILRG